MGSAVAAGSEAELLVSIMLTEREKDVLQLLARGLSAKEIANRLAICSRTVESHVERMRLKTRTRNSTHMVAQAMWTGIISLSG